MALGEFDEFLEVVGFPRGRPKEPERYVLGLFEESLNKARRA
jgi:hypothetical protein